MYLSELLFCDKRKFKRLIMDDAKRIKKKQVTLILYSFTPCDVNFNAQSDFGKLFVTKNLLIVTKILPKSL